MDRMSSIEKAKKVKEKHQANLLSKNNVNGLGVGYKIKDGQMTTEVVIRVYVDKKLENISTQDQIPSEIEGVKTDVIESSSNASAQNFHIDTTAHANVVGGINVGPAYIINGKITNGTLGTIVRDIQTGKPMILGSYHVLELGRFFQLGNEISQPAGPNNKIIARICRASLNPTVDAAVAKLNKNVNFSPQINLIGSVQGTVSDFELDAMVNNHKSHVRKFGISTGLTFGNIVEIGRTEVNIKYNFESQGRTFYSQMAISSDDPSKPFSLPGDSGSCIIDDFGRIVGLLLGAGNDGLTYANHIQDVMNQLQIIL